MRFFAFSNPNATGRDWLFCFVMNTDVFPHFLIAVGRG